MIPKESIRIVDGLDVVVPKSNSLMTPFVLKEQKDWFEDEIKFIRILLQPGMRVIDIGANYGVYTLSCAKKIGNEGELWAFEPTSAVAECLRESINLNRFSNTTLIQKGLSNREGDAELSINPNAELNSLNVDITEGGPSESITLTTLDACSRKYNWNRIDFIKLDAEGEEERILDGGVSFLERLSPVVLYELKHGDKVNQSLINKFDQIGYPSYYLLPGPSVLVPFDVGMEIDPYQLNLFAIKKDQVGALSRRGLLLEHTDFDHKEIRQAFQDDLWVNVFRERKFAAHFLDAWICYCDNRKDDEGLNQYLQAVNLYAHTLNVNIGTDDLVSALLRCESILSDLLSIDKIISTSITMMYARVLFDLGKRAIAVGKLGDLLNSVAQGNRLAAEWPFFPPIVRYDEISVKADDKENWILSSILEPYMTKQSFSSYFSDKSTIHNLEILQSLGYCDDEIGRRIDLLQRREQG